MTDFIIAISSDLVRAGMYASLTQHKFRVVASVNTFPQLRQEVNDYPYATVILCSQLAGDGTIEAWRRLQRRYVDLQLLLWGRQVQDILDFQCTLKRVDGYLLDKANLNEFIEGCQAVNKGQMYVAQAVAEYLARNPKHAQQRSLVESLSDREVQVTQMIGRGLRVMKIAQHLNISAKTVNTFRYRIFTKLGVSGDVELTHLAIQSGLVDLEQPVVYEH